jgi:hypothetical protein
LGRKLLAGILGGIAFFAWSSIAHMVLPLGTTGVKEIDSAFEAPVMAAMQANIHEHGLYLFPGLHVPANANRAQQSAAMNARMEKVGKGPSGLLIYHPVGDTGFGRMLLVEFSTNVVQIFLAVLLLGYTNLTSFAARWRFISIAGVLACISTNISYWNWYGFPGSYTLAYSFTILMGFVFAGLVAAAMMKPKPVASMAKASVA